MTTAGFTVTCRYLRRREHVLRRPRWTSYTAEPRGCLAQPPRMKGTIMRGTVLHAPGDIRSEQLDDPKIIQPTDATVRLSATCVCGSDLWDYRGINPANGPTPIGHEYCGIVEDVGGDVKAIKPGQFVIGSFFASDIT